MEERNDEKVWYRKHSYSHISLFHLTACFLILSSIKFISFYIAAIQSNKSWAELRCKVIHLIFFSIFQNCAWYMFSVAVMQGLVLSQHFVGLLCLLSSSSTNVTLHVIFTLCSFQRTFQRHRQQVHCFFLRLHQERHLTERTCYLPAITERLLDTSSKLASTCRKFSVGSSSAGRNSPRELLNWLDSMGSSKSELWSRMELTLLCNSSMVAFIWNRNLVNESSPTHPLLSSYFVALADIFFIQFLMTSIPSGCNKFLKRRYPLRSMSYVKSTLYRNLPEVHKISQGFALWIMCCSSCCKQAQSSLT